jgi:beta-glucuronidase
VVLYTVPQTYIEDVMVVTDIEGADGAVKVTARLNEPISASGSVHLKGNGMTVKAALAFQNGMAEVWLTASNVRLWSDMGPYLYDLTVQSEQDRYTLQVGVRTVAVQGGQVLLNGRRVQMNGYGRHEDFIASGKGLNLPLLVKDYQLRRWTGAPASCGQRNTRRSTCAVTSQWQRARTISPACSSGTLPILPRCRASYAWVA